MPEFRGSKPDQPTREEKDLYNDEIRIEKEIISRACKTGEKKTQWIKKYALAFRKIVEDPDIIEMIKEDKEKAIEEIEKRIYESK